MLKKLGESFPAALYPSPSGASSFNCHRIPFWPGRYALADFSKLQITVLGRSGVGLVFKSAGTPSPAS
jgi:hypothetical protein